MARYKKMNPFVKKKWLAALRSGEYRQGRSQLYSRFNTDADHHSYCCLGVLCELVGVLDKSRQRAEYEGEKSVTRLPEGLAWDLNIGPQAQEKLIAMNDGVKKPNHKPASFLEIADWIEAKL